jgi:hypothetical protein
MLLSVIYQKKGIFDNYILKTTRTRTDWKRGDGLQKFWRWRSGKIMMMVLELVEPVS